MYYASTLMAENNPNHASQRYRQNLASFRANTDSAGSPSTAPSMPTFMPNPTYNPSNDQNHNIPNTDLPFDPMSLNAQFAAQRRQIAIDNVMSSLRELGYDTSQSRSQFNATIAAFFHHHSTPTERLEALVQMFVTELENLMPHVREENLGGQGVREWKEGTLTRLVRTVMPALTGLLGGLTREINGVLEAQGGEVRLGGGNGELR